MDRHPSRGHAGKAPALPPTHAPDFDAAEFAEYLRAERERRSLTLEQVSGETKIASRHLAALERGDVRNWPGGMYRRAMMRAYAESIGVDREFALKQFEQAFETQQPPEPPLPPPVAGPPRARWRPTPRQAYAAGASLLTLVAIAIIWTVVTSFPATDPPPAGLTPRSAAVPAAPAPSTGGPSPAARESEQAAATAPAPQPVSTTGTTPAGPLATEGTLVIESAPAGARVTVNGIGWGETPLTIRHLEFGAKRIRLTLQDYVSEERSVSLAPDRPNGRVRIALRARP
jgi:cytoskeletal protein RodZ